MEDNKPTKDFEFTDEEIKAMDKILEEAVDKILYGELDPDEIEMEKLCQLEF